MLKRRKFRLELSLTVRRKNFSKVRARAASTEQVSNVFKFIHSRKLLPELLIPAKLHFTIICKGPFRNKGCLTGVYASLNETKRLFTGGRNVFEERYGRVVVPRVCKVRRSKRLVQKKKKGEERKRNRDNR